jgi:hypothetical protein
MAIEVWDAEEIAGVLLGIDDAKADLKNLLALKQEGVQSENYVDEITEAAERWNTLLGQTEEWLEKHPVAPIASNVSDS